MNKTVQIAPFKIVGISVTTTNEGGKAKIDLGRLWEEFYSEDIPSKVSEKTSNNIFCIYTDYKSDFRGVYTAIVGCQVDSLVDIPDGLVGRFFHGGSYLKFTAKGRLQGAVTKKWQEIWDKENELGRKYTADFERYGDRSQDPESAEIDIFIAVE